MKCPKCGKELTEGASFCLYCMTSLDEKREATPRFFPKKRWIVFFAVILVVGVALIIWYLLTKASPEDQPSQAAGQTASPTITQTEPTSTAQTEPLRINTLPICTFFAFQDGAMYMESQYWNPFCAFLLESDYEHELYDVPVELEGADLKLDFERDGCRIRGVLDHVSEKDLDSAVVVMNELLDLLCDPGGMDPGPLRFDKEQTSRQAVLSPQYFGFPEAYAKTELKQENGVYILTVELR